MDHSLSYLEFLLIVFIKEVVPLDEISRVFLATILKLFLIQLSTIKFSFIKVQG